MPRAAKSNVTVKRVYLTPKKAQEFLDSRALQRPLSMHHVAELVDEIANDEWADSNDMICFDDAGHLINGQHRCQAVIEAGKPIWVFVAYGMKRRQKEDGKLGANPFNKMDIPRRRTGGDVAAMMGFKDTNTASAVASIVYAYENNLFTTGNAWPRLSNERVSVELKRLKNEIERSIQMTPKIPRLLGIGRSIIVAVHLLAARHDPKEADAFSQIMATGSSSPSLPGVVSLRESLLRRGKGSRTGTENLTALIKAWNRRHAVGTRQASYVRHDEPVPLLIEDRGE